MKKSFVYSAKGDQPKKKKSRRRGRQLRLHGDEETRIRADLETTRPKRTPEDIAARQEKLRPIRERRTTERRRRSRLAPPRAAQEQLGAAADPGDMARAEGGKNQRAALLKQAEEAAAKLTELMAKLAGTKALPLAARTDREDRLMAATVILQMVEPTNQPPPELGTRVRTVAVGVLRAEEPEDGMQWLCRVFTCAGSYHPLRTCPEFLQMPAKERGDLVAPFNLC
jgi:hypothetical protein